MEVIDLLKKRPYGFIGAVILILVILLAALSPLIAPFGFNEINIQNRLQPSGDKYIWGTDQIGRDIFSRFIYGARPYVEVGLLVMCWAGVLGLSFGLLGALNRGKSNIIVYVISIVTLTFIVVGLLGWFLLKSYFSYFVSVFIFFPEHIVIITAVLLALVFLAALYNRIFKMFHEENVLTEGDSLSQKKAKPARLIITRLLKEYCPVCLSIFILSTGAAVAILVPLGFFGVGVPPPSPEWGSLITSGRMYDALEKAPIFLYPILAISITTVGTILYGFATRELWFPRLIKPTA